MIDLTAIVLTYNEENNLPECLNSLKDLVRRIIVVDSFSTDKTKDIALSFGADFYQHEFVNQAQQFDYALKNIEITTKWIIRLDADERLTEESRKEIEEQCCLHENDDVNGLVLRFKLFFLGKYLKHGGTYPVKKMVVFKKGFAEIEQKNMDEHIVLLSGKSTICKKDCLHHDCKSITDWVAKHNKYADRESIDYLSNRSADHARLDSTAKNKNKIKSNFYYKLPLGFRAWIYYIYRFYFRLGFLDGRPGKYYAFLQAYWYRFLVDIKIYENKIKNK